MVNRKESLKVRVFAYMDAHPRMTLAGVFHRFYKENKTTLRCYFNQYYNHEKERSLLENGIKTLLNILVNKTQPIKKISKKELSIIEAVKEVINE